MGVRARNGRTLVVHTRYKKGVMTLNNRRMQMGVGKALAQDGFAC